MLLVSAIWGFAFVAQRAGMEYIGPFLFNGVRFTLGGLWILPFILFRKEGQASRSLAKPAQSSWMGGILLGIILFIAASLQQVGISHTTAGKAGFITGLYVILVPILGLFLKKRSRRLTWVAALLAMTGLYFLSIHGQLLLARGDLLVFIGAFFWALHVLGIDYLVHRVAPLQLAAMQFLICAGLSLVAAVFWETISIPSMLQAAIPILYTGILSVGVGYTLQVVAQREAHPSHAAIILSLEAVFAVIGGTLMLAEVLSARETLGCFLMLTGMILSQLNFSPAVSFFKRRLS